MIDSSEVRCVSCRWMLGGPVRERAPPANPIDELELGVHAGCVADDESSDESVGLEIVLLSPGGLELDKRTGIPLNMSQGEFDKRMKHDGYVGCR